MQVAAKQVQPQHGLEAGGREACGPPLSWAGAAMPCQASWSWPLLPPSSISQPPCPREHGHQPQCRQPGHIALPHPFPPLKGAGIFPPPLCPAATRDPLKYLCDPLLGHGLQVEKLCPRRSQIAALFMPFKDVIPQADMGQTPLSPDTPENSCKILLF